VKALKHLFNIIVLSLLLLTTASVEAQSSDTLISGSFVDQPLPNVLSYVKKMYLYKFAYDATTLKEYRVTDSFDNLPIDKFLEELLNPFDLGFRKVGKIYVVVPLFKVSEVVVKDSVVALSIRGQVEDSETGEPLPFANVRVRNFPIIVQCDVRGRFEINPLPSDTCTLVVNYVGYDEQLVRAVKLLREKSPVIGITAKRGFLPAAVVEAAGVELFESADEPSLQSLNPLDISNVNGPGQPDIMRAAQLLPGINATNESSNGLIIRGSTGDQSLLSIDGFTVYHMDHFFGLISAINPTAVKNMRIYKAPGEARLNSRVGGAVQITAKEGSRYVSGGRIDIGPLFTGVFVETPLGKKNNASAMIAARRSITDLIPTSTYKSLFNTIYLSGITSAPDENPLNNADYSFNDVLGKVTWRPNEKTLLFISGYSSNDDLSIQYSTSDKTGNYVYDYSDISGWGNRGLGAGWDYQWNERTRHKLNVGLSSYTSNLFAVDTLKDLRYNDFDRQFRQDNNRLSDLSIHYETEISAHNGSYFIGGNFNRILIERGGEGLEKIVADTTSASISTLFLERKYLNEKWNATAGLRLNHFSKTNELYPEWRLLASYKINEKFLFKGSVTRSYQFIHRVREQSLYLNQPDTWLLSDESRLPVLSCDQAVVGAKGNWKGLDWDFESYIKLYNGIAIDNSAWKNYILSPDVFFKGDAYSYGFDIMLNKLIGQHNVSLSYTLSKTRYRIDNLDQKDEIPSQYDQLHEMKFYYEYRWKAFDVSLIWVYGSGRPFTAFYGYYDIANVGGGVTSIPIYGAINGTRLPAYHRLDLSLGYTLAREKITWSIRGGVYNVYDRKNIRDIQYLAFPTDDGGNAIEKRNVAMIGRVPSVQLTIAF
jgi:hypothetical protein